MSLNLFSIFVEKQLFVHVKSSLGNVYLPNNLLCARTSPCMPCYTHEFTMINILRSIFGRVLLLLEQDFFSFCFRIIKVHIMYLAAADL